MKAGFIVQFLLRKLVMLTYPPWPKAVTWMAKGVIGSFFNYLAVRIADIRGRAKVILVVVADAERRIRAVKICRLSMPAKESLARRDGGGKRVRLGAED